MKEIEEYPLENSVVPGPAELDRWSNREWMNGVQIDELKEFDTLSIQTKNHKYEITIINPDTAEVLVRGGEFFPERTAARILGASMGGSFLKLRGIYLGFKLELQVADRHVTTSPVCGIGMVGAACPAITRNLQSS